MLDVLRLSEDITSHYKYVQSTVEVENLLTDN